MLAFASRPATVLPMDITAVILRLRYLSSQVRAHVRTYWQPALVIVGVAVTFVGLVATTYALTRTIGWGPAATVAGACAAAIGLLAPRFRVEDRT